MASELIGLIVGYTTGIVHAVINPDDDAELDNPRWLLHQVKPDPPEDTPPTDGDDQLTYEPMTMVTVPRGEYMGALSMADVAELAQKYSG
jgi:hypothetical protein